MTFLDIAVDGDELALAVPECVFVLTYVVLSTCIQYPAESFRHVVMGLAFVYNIIRIYDTSYTIQFLSLTIELTLHYLAVLEHLFVILKHMLIEVDQDLTLFSDFIDCEWAKALPHVNTLSLLFRINLRYPSQQVLYFLLLIRIRQRVNSYQSLIELPKFDFEIEELTQIAVELVVYRDLGPFGS